MKLLLEEWRKYITEDWRDTSWETDDGKVSIGDVIDHLEKVREDTIDINVRELVTELPTLPIGGGDVGEALNRMSAASLEFPIIVVKFGGKYQFVLDGNHRLGKAFVCGDKEATIEARILDLDNPETPEVFKKVLG